MTDHPLFRRRPADAFDAEDLVAAISNLLCARKLVHRPPPPIPTTCCGRGCSGCVWESYFEALKYWQADAARLLG